jgi:hypothetical protein
MAAATQDAQTVFWLRSIPVTLVYRRMSHVQEQHRAKQV